MSVNSASRLIQARATQSSNALGVPNAPVSVPRGRCLPDSGLFAIVHSNFERRWSGCLVYGGPWRSLGGQVCGLSGRRKASTDRSSQRRANGDAGGECAKYDEPLAQAPRPRAQAANALRVSVVSGAWHCSFDPGRQCKWQAGFLPRQSRDLPPTLPCRPPDNPTACRPARGQGLLWQAR